MKKLLAILILIIFTLGGLFHGSHIHVYNDHVADVSTNTTYMRHYPKLPEVMLSLFAQELSVWCDKEIKPIQLWEFPN